MRRDWDNLKQNEERKRDAAFDPVRRWQILQQTITWAEANLPRELQRNRPRTRRQPASAAGHRTLSSTR